MLTAEIKINGASIAQIEAKNIRTISDEPGDFIGDRATVCEYACVVTWVEGPHSKTDYQSEFTITHDRRFGWQGLLNKITSEVIPVVVETVSMVEAVSTEED